jgi:L-ascorbate metabolism protein UlaG (beta-lactamase superfamily)
MLGQSGVALRSGDDLVLIDPFLSPRPDRVAEPIADPSGLVGVTAILATHEHGDHLDLPTWTVLAAASQNAGEEALEGAHRGNDPTPTPILNRKPFLGGDS